MVVPGDLLSEDPKLASQGTYVEGGKVYSLNYGLVDRRNNIKVIPLSGRYIPARGDLVIGKVNDMTFSNWFVDINSPYEGMLHVSEFPERVDPGNMSKYLHVGELIIARVADVDPSMKVELTLRDEQPKGTAPGQSDRHLPHQDPPCDRKEWLDDQHAEEGSELQHLRRAERQDLAKGRRQARGSGHSHHL